MTKIEKICEQCGKAFYVHHCLKDKSKYCSKTCQHKSMEKNYNIRCEQCGKIFKSKLLHTATGRRKYCSLECAAKGNSKQIKCTCNTCGKTFHVQQNVIKSGGGKYCCVDCYYKSLEKNQYNYCKVCGKKIKISSWDIERGWGIYCSRKCKAKAFIGENNPAWKGGVSFEPYCILFNDEFKERVRSYYGNKCALCGKTEKEYMRKLDVHHVNYDKITCCNDSERLFVPLCASCHSKTNVNRGYWQEYFTKMIDEEYAGKCYYTKEEYNAISSA